MSYSGSGSPSDYQVCPGYPTHENGLILKYPSPTLRPFKYLAGEPLRKPLEQFSHHQVVAFAVWVVPLRHQIFKSATSADTRSARCQAVGQTDTVFPCQVPDLLRVLVQRIGWIIQVRAQIRCGCEENHFDALVEGVG